MTAAALIALGAAVGTYGTVIGAGGGFVLVPILLLLYPDEPPAVITSISLLVVFVNALSGSFAFYRMGRIDVRSGWRFALATLPGAVVGAWLVQYMDREAFDVIFALLLLGLAAYIYTRSAPVHHTVSARKDKAAGRSFRRVVDAEGHTYAYSYNTSAGIVLSVAVGLLSSLFGIGGGILHVPLLVTLLGFPTHIATATSYFVLSFSTLAGSVVHIASGSLAGGWERALLLAVGVSVGSQIGARISHRVHGVVIMRLLAAALLIVGARILWSAF